MLRKPSCCTVPGPCGSRRAGLSRRSNYGSSNWYIRDKIRLFPHWCNGCLGHLSGKRSVMHWILATFLLCLACSSRRVAKELGVHIRTSYRWCWWLRNAALSYEMGRQLAGTVEADDLYHTAGNKGQAKG